MNYSYISYIDGLRAIAVLSVIIYHLNSTWLPGGFIGVDIFFTISGFVVSFSIAQKGGTNLVNFITSFYARRILRIVPALLICLMLVSVAEILFIPPGSFLSNGIEITGQYAFWGLSNLILMQSSNYYFGPKAEFNPFTHTWSLGIEEQFYLIFPMLFYWWTIGDKNKHFRYISISIFTILFAISLTYAYWLSNTDPLSAFYSIFTRFWELAAGVILYQATANKYNNSERSLGFLGLIGAPISLVLVILGFVFARPDHFPFPWALLPVFGTIGLLAFLRNKRNKLILAVLNNQSVVFIGKISYSLYLWHWPIFVLFRWTVGLDSIQCYIAAVFFTFLLAIVSYYFVERPIRYSRKILNLQKAKIIFIGLAIVALCYTINNQIVLNQAQLSLSVISREDKLWHDHWLDIEAFNKLHKNCEIAGSAKWIEGGDVFLRYSKPICQPQRTFNQLFVAGDSHAYNYMPMLQRLVMETDTDIVIYSKPGCTYINFFTPLALRDSYNCNSFFTAMITDILSQAKQGDIVFLPGLRLLRFAEQWMLYPKEIVNEHMSSAKALAERAMATKEAVTLLKLFTEKGIKVVFEAPKPIFFAPPFRCSDWFNRINPICFGGLEVPKNFLLNNRLSVMESMQTLSKQVFNVSIWDPFPVLCPSNFCQAIMDHKPLFFDGDHLSGYGNMLLYPSFKTFITHLQKPIV